MSLDEAADAVVVLGARGFVGRRIVERLVADPSLRPIAVARRPPADAKGVEWRMCDATHSAAIRAAVVGAAYAVNCVAGDAETMIAATRNLCAAARTAGLRRIVHLSSMAVYGDATGLVSEDRELTPGGGWYGQSKVACETIIGDFMRAGGDGVILRPGCIHGPGSEQWTTRIARLLRRHRIGDLGVAGDGACNLIDVGDVAEAVVTALDKPGIGGQAYNLGDPDPGTWNAYFIALARAIGATPVRTISDRWLKIETKGLAIPLKLTQIAAARVGRAHLVPDPLPPSLLSLWRQDIALDHRKADAELGFVRTPQDTALAAAAAWFTSRH